MAHDKYSINVSSSTLLPSTTNPVSGVHKKRQRNGGTTITADLKKTLGAVFTPCFPQARISISQKHGEF